MRKHFVLLLALVLCIGLLSGCGAKETSAPHAFQDLTIRIPADYIDLSEEVFADGLDFVFGKEPIAISGLRDAKETFATYGLELDLQQYGQLLMESNQVRCQLAQTDGIWNFSYTSGDFTYVVTLWETDDAFWTVQAYCPTADYHKNHDQMWKILTSVSV